MDELTFQYRTQPMNTSCDLFTTEPPYQAGEDSGLVAT